MSLAERGTGGDYAPEIREFPVFPRRADTIGFVGQSGRSTGPHLHYEVRINDTPVNPYNYLRITMAHLGGFAAGE